MKTTLGQLESRVLAYAQMRSLKKVKVGELADPLKLSNRQEREVLSQLASAGMIARVRQASTYYPRNCPSAAYGALTRFSLSPR